MFHQTRVTSGTGMKLLQSPAITAIVRDRIDVSGAYSRSGGPISSSAVATKLAQRIKTAIANGRPCGRPARSHCTPVHSDSTTASIAAYAFACAAAARHRAWATYPSIRHVRSATKPKRGSTPIE